MYVKARTFRIASNIVNTCNDTSGGSEVWLSGYVGVSESDIEVKYTDMIKIVKAMGWH